MGNVLGLVELLLVFFGAMGFGAYQLWILSRDRKSKDRAPLGRKDGPS